jgi:hypothetical protein
MERHIAATDSRRRSDAYDVIPVNVRHTVRNQTVSDNASLSNAFGVFRLMGHVPLAPATGCAKDKQHNDTHDCHDAGRQNPLQYSEYIHGA